MKSIFDKKYHLLILVVLAAIFRLGGITWGLPFYFHPDEWNMAYSISNLSWQEKLNPHFFAYGQFPLYLSYFSAKIYNLLPWINLKEITVSQAIFFLRFWSAIAGIGTVSLVYLISKHLFTSHYLALLAALLSVFTPGLIQNSHFGTTEAILTLGFLGIIFCSLKILGKPSFKLYLLAALFIAITLGSKITALVFFVPLTLASLYQLLKFKKKKIVLFFISSLSAALALTLIFSPYLMLSFSETKRILTYETQIAAGKITVFYTRQFSQTLPVIFQLQKIFPYALGWPIFILGGIGVLIAITIVSKEFFARKKLLPSHYSWLIVLGSFVAYFCSQAFLFTKWTRFMSPIFPFFSIFTALSISYLGNPRPLKIKTLLIPVVLIAIFPGIMFFTIYLQPDIRFTASEWIYRNIPAGSKILSETGNVIDIPVLPSNYPHYQSLITNYAIISFDFYHLDEDPKLFPVLIDQLSESDYIFIPSRRIFANHIKLPEKYPLTAKYYDLLFSGKLGFNLVKEFSRQSNDESAEETWSVFDHPVIRIYKKDKVLSRENYSKLLSN